jgi:hypothetical protein
MKVVSIQQKNHVKIENFFKTVCPDGGDHVAEWRGANGTRNFLHMRTKIHKLLSLIIFFMFYYIVRTPPFAHPVGSIGANGFLVWLLISIKSSPDRPIPSLTRGANGFGVWVYFKPRIYRILP